MWDSPQWEQGIQAGAWGLHGRRCIGRDARTDEIRDTEDSPSYEFGRLGSACTVKGGHVLCCSGDDALWWGGSAKDDVQWSFIVLCFLWYSCVVSIPPGGLLAIRV